MQRKSISVLMFGLILSILMLGFRANAQELTKDAKIERILVLTKGDAMIDQLFSQIKAMTASQLPRDATAEQRDILQAFQDKLMDLVKTRISPEKLRPQYVKLYRDTFSDEEINGLLAFYESPAGHAMIEKMPLLLANSMALGQAQMSDIMPEIKRLSDEVVQQLRRTYSPSMK